MPAICGLVGGYAAEAGAEAELLGMLAALAARGRGDPLVRGEPGQPVLLGARPAATAAGAPSPSGVFTSEDGRLLMVCDGHMFNAAEIASWLRGQNRAPRTSHPCELLLHLYDVEGPAGWRRADAQFALAIWDGRRRRLVLARDFLGVQPLCYRAGARGVAFASEIKGLLQHPALAAAFDPVGVSHYLTFLTVPGPRTLFADVCKVPPGSAATLSPDGTVEIAKYWDLLDAPIPERDDEAFYVDRVRELHRGAVTRRAVEGPIAALLSGGNDSSANAALLAKHAGGPLHTFTVGLREVEGQQRYSDLEYARRVAKHIGSIHHEDLLSIDDFLACIPTTIDALDDLVSEPSSVFLHRALRLVKEQGLGTVITGEANDEISCGHGEMIHIRDGYYRRWLPYQRVPAPLRRLIALAAPTLSPKRSDILHRAASGEEYFWNYETAWMESEKADILTASAYQRCRADSPAKVVARYAEKVRASEHGRRDYLNHIIYLMMQDYYFGNLMLNKLDLLAGQLGLDARCPYTEPQYAHFVYNIPAKLKTRDGLVKYFFKKAIADLLPSEIIYRPKQGFRTPVVEMFQGKLGDWARPILLEEGLTKAGFLRRDALEKLLADHRAGVRDYSNRLWTVMVLNLWHGRWIESPRRTATRTPATAVSAGDDRAATFPS